MEFKHTKLSSHRSLPGPPQRSGARQDTID